MFLVLRQKEEISHDCEESQDIWKNSTLVHPLPSLFPFLKLQSLLCSSVELECYFIFPFPYINVICSLKVYLCLWLPKSKISVKNFMILCWKNEVCQDIKDAKNAKLSKQRYWYTLIFVLSSYSDLQLYNLKSIVN